MENTSLLVSSQVPDFVRNDSPKFISFLEAYYEFMQGYRLEIETLRDVDRVSNDLLGFLRNEFVKNFPAALISERKLIKLVRKIYDAKGTINAVELLFKIFFNENVIVYQPSKNILRASDGKWNEEYSITVSSVYGSIDFDSQISLRIENNLGSFEVDVIRYERINDNLTRFFYKSFSDIFVTDNQFVDIIGPNNTITFRGLIVRSPRRIVVLSPGKYWKRGQIFSVPGTEVPTLAQATAVDNDGRLLAVSIVKFGYEHAENQTTTISPFLNKPPPGSYEYDKVQTGTTVEGDPIYTHTLTLNDFGDSIGETLNSISNKVTELSYALSDYFAEFYAGISAFSFTSTVSPLPIEPESSATYEQWLESRATLVYEFDYIVKYLGSYSSNSGHISDPEIRLQDNYFYQLFSYVIETQTGIDDYRTAVAAIHPAGLKYFSDLNKVATLDEIVDLEVVFETN